VELSGERLNLGRREADLSQEQLWLRCFALGGALQPVELEAVLHGALRPDRQSWNVIAHVLNERFDELGMSQRVAYNDLEP